MQRPPRQEDHRADGDDDGPHGDVEPLGDALVEHIPRTETKIAAHSEGESHPGGHQAQDELGQSAAEGHLPEATGAAAPSPVSFLVANVPVDL